MVRHGIGALALVALVACTRIVQVDSLGPHVGRADRLRLSSGERVRVDRIVAQSADAVLVESSGRSRRIALDDVVAVEDRERLVGFAEGGGIGMSAGLAAGLGTWIYSAATCDPGTDAFGDALCDLASFYAGTVVAIVGAIVLGGAGGGIGAAIGHTDVYQRRSPITVAPTGDGVTALWTVEF